MVKGVRFGVESGKLKVENFWTRYSDTLVLFKVRTQKSRIQAFSHPRNV